MPTGYTDMIDKNPDMTTEQWIMEGLARAFGVCVTLRDDRPDLTEEQIKKKIEENERQTVNYHQKELKKARKELKRLNVLTEKEWLVEWNKAEKNRIENNNHSISITKKLKDRHNKVRNDLEKILASSKISKITRNIVKYGIDQLNMVQSECEPYTYKNRPLRLFKSDKVKSASRDIVYHTKELVEAKKRMRKRIYEYSRLRKDLNMFGIESINS